MSSKQNLVVEDEPSISDSLVGVLGKEGFNSTVAGTIIDARQALESNLWMVMKRIFLFYEIFW